MSPCSHTHLQGLDMDTFVQALGAFPGVKATLVKAKAGDPEAQHMLAKWMAKGATHAEYTCSSSIHR